MHRILSKYSGVILPSFVVLFAAKYLLGFSDAYGILALVFGVFVFAIQPMAMKRFCMLDWAVTAFSIVSIALSFSGGITTASLSESAFFAMCLAMYFAIKQKDVQHTEIFLTTFFILASVAMSLAVVSFFIFRTNVLNAGFTDVYDFRFLYRPLGFTCNFWAESVVILAALSLYLKKYWYVFFSLSVLAALLTFSRGAYIALSVLTAGFFVIEKAKNERKNFLISISIALIFTALFCHVELFKTISFNTQPTQQQSTAWRMESIGDDWEVFINQPLIGYGADSYGDMTGKNQDYDSRKNFSGVAPNVFSKIGIEKGVLGIIAMLFLIVVVIHEINLNFKNKEITIAALVFAVIFVKELSQSSFAENRFTIFVCYVLFGTMTKCYRLGNTSHEYPIMRWCVYLMVVPVLAGIGGKYFNDFQFSKPYPEAIQNYICAISWLENNKLQKAENKLKNLCEKYPSCGEFNFALGNVYLRKNDTSTAIELIAKAINLQPKIINSEDFLEIIKSDSATYNKLKNTVINSVYNLNTPQDRARMGFVYQNLGLADQAKLFLKSAVDEMPSLSTPWLLLGDTVKYNLLTRGAFQGEDHKITIPTENFSVYEMFCKTYIDRQ